VIHYGLQQDECSVWKGFQGSYLKPEVKAGLTWTHHRYTLISDEGTPMKPTLSAKITNGCSENFTSFMRRLMQVPHSEIMARLDAEREAKRTPKPSASRVPVASPKRAT